MVRCRDCGLLGARYKDKTLGEVDEKARETGLVVPNRGEPILCSLGRSPLIAYQPCDECERNLHNRHECDAFVQWHRGRSPKEHQEMIDMKAERDWREKESRLDRDWREQQATAQRTWQEDQAKQQRQWREEDIRRERFDFWFGRIAIPIFAAILAAAVAFTVTGWRISAALTQ